MTGSIDYSLWRTVMCTFLKGRKLWKYVDASVSMPVLDKNMPMMLSYPLPMRQS